jgi:hypothetical protein
LIRIALLFSIVLVAYDALAAIIAKLVGVSYTSFVLLALVLIFFMGVLAGRKARSWAGIVPVAIAATVEATAGWYAASLIGPGYVPGWTMGGLIEMAIESALLSACVGAAGVWVGLGVAQARRSR